MNSLQVTTQQQCCNFTSCCHFRSASPARAVVPAGIFGPPKTGTTLRAFSSNYLGAGFPNVCLRLSSHSSGYHKRAPVCVFGGEGKSEKDDQQGSPFNVFEKGIGFLRKDSVEEVLRKQIEKQEYVDDGGSGGSGPGGGGGGGSSSGGPGDENIWDEVVQVIFGTIGFICLYMLIIEGEEITTFTKDIIKFIFTRRKSIRLRRLIDDWVRTFKSMTETKEEDPYALEKAIINTPTWWDSPEKYKLLYRRYLASKYED